MKNLKLTFFSAILLAFSALTSCTKEGIVPPVVPPPPGATTAAIFYLDSAKIYSTSLTGSDRKLVTGIDTTNPNSYIESMVRSNDGNKLYFFHYTSGSTPSAKLYSVNNDGTGLTMLKNMIVYPQYNLLKATADNRLVFSQYATLSPTVFSLQTINTDGTNQTTLATLPAGPFPQGLSTAVNRYISYDNPGGLGVFTLQTGTINGSTVNAPINIGPVYSGNSASLSSDGSKIAYAIRNTSNTIQIYVYDIATAASQLKFTHTIVSGISFTNRFYVSVRWVGGTDKILLGYCNLASGTPADFTQFTLYTVSNSAQATWRFEGDQVQNVVTQ